MSTSLCKLWTQRNRVLDCWCFPIRTNIIIWSSVGRGLVLIGGTGRIGNNWLKMRRGWRRSSGTVWWSCWRRTVCRRSWIWSSFLGVISSLTRSTANKWDCSLRGLVQLLIILWWSKSSFRLDFIFFMFNLLSLIISQFYKDYNNIKVRYEHG